MHAWNRSISLRLMVSITVIISCAPAPPPALQVPAAQCSTDQGNCRMSCTWSNRLRTYRLPSHARRTWRHIHPQREESMPSGMGALTGKGGSKAKMRPVVL